MRRVVNMHEAKSRLSQLVELAEAGEDVVIARALEDGIPLVSCDRALAPYPIQLLW